jgi:hypothetical protein
MDDEWRGVGCIESEPAQRRWEDWGGGTYGADEEPLDHGVSREVRCRVEASEVVAGSQDVVDAKRGLFAECLLAHLHNVDHLALVLLGRGRRTAAAAAATPRTSSRATQTMMSP